MQLDYEKYRHHLKKHGFSTQQENEIMDLMWRTMEAAAEKAWGMSPIQNIENEKIEFSLRKGDGWLDSKEQSVRKTFSDSSLPATPERIH